MPKRLYLQAIVLGGTERIISYYNFSNAESINTSKCWNEKQLVGRSQIYYKSLLHYYSCSGSLKWSFIVTTVSIHKNLWHFNTSDLLNENS